MSTIIIITPPPPPPKKGPGEPDGFAQDLDRTSPYAEARQAIEQAEAVGGWVHIIKA